MKFQEDFKARILGLFSSVSAFFATLGSSFQLCHSICIALIAVLSAIGIVIAGFPLFFLFEYAVLFWGIAVLLIIPSAIMLLKGMKCIPKNLLIFNSGVIIAGIPSTVINLPPFSWIVGGVIVFVAVLMFFYARLEKRKEAS